MLTTTLPEWLSGREENDRRNYLMINLHESMGPGGDRPLDVQSDKGQVSHCHSAIIWASTQKNAGPCTQKLCWIILLRVTNGKIAVILQSDALGTAQLTQYWLISSQSNGLTLKVPITTAADDKFCDILPNFGKNKVSYFMRIVCWQTILIKYLAVCVTFEKQQNLKLSSAANYRWRFMG